MEIIMIETILWVRLKETTLWALDFILVGTRPRFSTWGLNRVFFYSLSFVSNTFK